jgi:hypothetical protein
METRPYDRWFHVGMLVLRIGFGLGFLFYHGWAKITGGPERWTGVGSAVSHLGIQFGHTGFGFIAALAESVGGILIAAGLLFRPAAVLIAVSLVTAPPPPEKVDGITFDTTRRETLGPRGAGWRRGDIVLSVLLAAVSQPASIGLSRGGATSSH